MRRRRRRIDPIRSIGLLGGFGSIADGFASISEGMDGLMGVDVEDPNDGNGRWLYKRKPLHPCALPDFAKGTVGDVWQCAECGSQWLVTRSEDQGLVMERIQAPLWQGTYTTMEPSAHTTAGNGYTYTYTTRPYWWSSETETRRDGPEAE